MSPKLAIEPLTRLRFAAHELVEKHPPQFDDESKRAVYEIACARRTTHVGEITYTRWSAMDLGPGVHPADAVQRAVVKPGIFEYDAHDDGAVHWHLNFADRRLFIAYGTSLLAQDELQVAEHPALGSLVEALDATGHRALTVEGGSPTPILVMGAQRLCRIATDANEAEGRPDGLYGNRFGDADLEVIRRATLRLDPPTVSNIIAINAPVGGTGAYAQHEIEHVLITAYTGFRAAVLESQMHAPDARTAIHTGWWGCGVFGGNKVLMAMLQIVAAQMAEVDHLHFYTVTDDLVEHVEEAITRLSTMTDEAPLATDAFVHRVLEMEFHWGVGDGN